MTKRSEKNSQKQVKGRFKPGQSGNPSGRPRGQRNKVSRGVLAMLEAESKGVTEALIANAKAGDSTALRIIMDRLVPPHKTPAREVYDCGPLDTGSE